MLVFTMPAWCEKVAAVVVLIKQVQAYVKFEAIEYTTLLPGVLGWFGE